uniref:Uncharacterized protein TCIL3000_4_3340 n=1 Tax=Trypanosoma congolense (strain IL3000) TaxID=1068625 RepID=G0ULH8_TRYCI|nr:unnamed protein product [Trypanosoma congolense IL3000]
MIATLYRRVLKQLTLVKRIGACGIVRECCAEYLPDGHAAETGADLLSVTRKAFEAAKLSPASVTKGFDFLKELAETLPELEVLSLWKAYIAMGDFDLLEGIAIASTALDVAGGTAEGVAPRVGACAATVQRTAEHLRRHVTEMKCALVQSGVTPQPPHGSGTATPQLQRVVSLLQERGYGVSEWAPEDHSSITFLRKKRASTVVMNAILALVLYELGLRCAVAGLDLYRPWVRIERPNKPMAFISLAHAGVCTAREVMVMHNSYQPSSLRLEVTPWSGKCRKELLAQMIHKQLALLSCRRFNGPLHERQQQLCRLQLEFLDLQGSHRVAPGPSRASTLNYSHRGELEMSERA